MYKNQQKLLMLFMQFISLAFMVSAFASFFIPLIHITPVSQWFYFSSGIIFFIFGFILLKIILTYQHSDSYHNKSKDNDKSQNGKSKSPELLFDNKTILITITLLNVILFIGGTIYSSIKIDSIEERYDKTILVLDSTEKVIRKRWDRFDKKLSRRDSNLAILEKRSKEYFKRIEENISSAKKETKREKDKFIEYVNSSKKQIKGTIDDLTQTVELNNREIENLENKSKFQLLRMKKTLEKLVSKSQEYENRLTNIGIKILGYDFEIILKYILIISILFVVFCFVIIVRLILKILNKIFK